MAEEREGRRQEQGDEAQNLPLVLLLHRIGGVARLEEPLSTRFRFLKAWESEMPLNVFLTTQAHSVRALLCSGKTPVTPDILQCLPSLQCLVTTSTGLNHIDLAECQRRDILVANAGNVFAEDGADFAVGLLLDVLGGISAGDRYVRGRLWPVQGDLPLGSKVISRILFYFLPPV